ncbi:nicotinate-nucleotide--dimethylbenzimidazole phosphoribosyltransferase [Shewanella sp. Isolate11]|uniref:nicotinate-nucleotide--dimethylbenzimidazole phosphoribosyltransferase n=1 Tax=Shewanella sp. Isolate11 TaxID=2908530 RepID=UPI001EFCECF7|nr:nicotinate-nucleotide--dimethylbenzimidazole phosphoribosyltransferase [Shewanella sp. Isolate11]MCG9697602.1 nicotinate-nucleotide--dimethylbenzimidazole phosphoribosyltransferase [Shewanella sp. Isolate11]
MFSITPVSNEFDQAIQAKIDSKTKPLGALGQLESLALQIARVLGKDKPEIIQPKLMVFAGDHGIAASGVSIAPSEVTTQMVANFLSGGAAINVFCAQTGFNMEVIDCGIAKPVADNDKLIMQRLGAGTRPFHLEAAMSVDSVEQGFAFAKERVDCHYRAGCNLIACGEMGIGNTSSAAAIMAAILKRDLDDCVGLGTGIDKETFARKKQLIAQALSLHQTQLDKPITVLAALGGFEIVQMTGAMLAAAERKMLILVDGFIATAAALVAVNIAPAARDYMIFAHESGERGHQLLLEHLQAKPLLKLGMRLGEGTGAALALPQVQAACGFYNDMASLQDLGIDI